MSLRTTVRWCAGAVRCDARRCGTGAGTVVICVDFNSLITQMRGERVSTVERSKEPVDGCCASAESTLRGLRRRLSSGGGGVQIDSDGCHLPLLRCCGQQSERASR